MVIGKLFLVLLLWIGMLILEGLTLIFAAFVPNHANILNVLGLFLLLFFPLCAIMGTVFLLR